MLFNKPLIAGVIVTTLAAAALAAPPDKKVPDLKWDQSQTFYVPGTDKPVDPPKGCAPGQEPTDYAGGHPAPGGANPGPFCNSK
jgi:hypothetical protein